jgi:hypothetical protein
VSVRARSVEFDFATVGCLANTVDRPLLELVKRWSGGGRLHGSVISKEKKSQFSRPTNRFA